MQIKGLLKGIKTLFKVYHIKQVILSAGLIRGIIVTYTF